MQGKEGTAVLETIHPGQSASSVSQPDDFTTPPLCPCVRCGVWCMCVPSLPIHLEIMHPPSPSVFSLLPCSRDRPVFLNYEQVPCPALSRPAFPCFFLILITQSSVRVPETCLWSGPGWYVCTYMCSVLSPPPSILCVCVCTHLQHRVYVCSRSWPHCRMDPTDGHLETQTCKHSNYPVGLHVRCRCSSSPSPMCLPISVYLPILHPSISLVQDPPRSHSLPTAAQSIESTSSVHLTALQEIHWIVEKGARLITR